MPRSSSRRPRWRSSRSRRTPACGAATCSAWPRRPPRESRTSARSPNTAACCSSSWPRASRPFKLGDRVLFRLLSRDEDPALLFEFQKLVKSDVEAEAWARGIMREAASAALAEAGYADDPRLRGRRAQDRQRDLPVSPEPAGREAVPQVGQADRSAPRGAPAELVLGGDALVHAQPPARARRLHRAPGALPRPAGAQEGVRHPGGKRTVKPQHLLLGDPIEADAKGQPTRPAAGAALHRADGPDGRAALGSGGLQGAGAAAQGLRRRRVSGGPRTCGRSPRPSTRSPTTTTRCWRTPRRPKDARWTSPSGWR